MFRQIWNDFKKRIIHDNRGIWPALAFLTNPAFWKGVAGVGSALGGAKALGGGEAQAPGVEGQQGFQTAKPPINLMGFPSMAPGNTNYGEIIKNMLQKQKLL
jgi:hypothetical protein